MSTTTRPGAGTLAFRRILVLVVLLTVVGGVIVGIRAFTAGSATASPMENAAKIAPPDPSVATGPVACEADDIDVELQPAAETFATGEQPRFVVRLTHAGRQPCLVDASQNGAAVTISDGDGEIWSSADCPVDERMLLMSPGDTDTSDVVWDRNRTDSKCKSTGAAGAGDFTARAGIVDVSGSWTAPEHFTLEPKPEPEPEPAETEKSSEEGESAEKEEKAESESAPAEPVETPAPDDTDTPAKDDEPAES